ncbi:MAG: hypothetical protein HY392_00890 [Candidatus Diapherotrites archaeon]|nr:hypothetical protein [Candidatus Diapherotrites archaeon]
MSGVEKNMGVETVFLEVLVVALGLGNVLLSLFFEGKPRVFPENSWKNALAEESPAVNPAGVQQGVENAAINQKLVLITRRLADIDSKLHTLDNFRANTRVELKGLMEILAELQDKNLTIRAKTFRKNEPELSTRQMHEIIYRSR